MYRVVLRATAVILSSDKLQKRFLRVDPDLSLWWWIVSISLQEYIYKTKGNITITPPKWANRLWITWHIYTVAHFNIYRSFPCLISNLSKKHWKSIICRLYKPLPMLAPPFRVLRGLRSPESSCSGASCCVQDHKGVGKLRSKPSSSLALSCSPLSSRSFSYSSLSCFSLSLPLYFYLSFSFCLSICPSLVPLIFHRQKTSHGSLRGVNWIAR